MKDYDAAIRHLSRAQAAVSNDPETEYYLGHAYLGTGDAVHARSAFEAAQRQPQLRSAAQLQLALLDAREGRRDEALHLLRTARSAEPGMVRAAALEVALLRTAGKTEQARELASAGLKEDPTSSFLRYELVRLGDSGEGLWQHLASDPERGLGIAVEYIHLGLYQDALDLLSRKYPAGDPLESEPGTPLPQDYALTAYYRGFCLEKLGKTPDEEYRAGSAMPTRYVFPYRATDLAILQDVVSRNPSDAIAHFYLGNIYLSAGMTDTAIAEWQKARSLKRDIPVLHRDLGRTLFTLKHDDTGALDIFREGLSSDPTNVDLYVGVTQVMSILDRPASERAAALEQYPDRAGMPTPLALDLALTYAEANQFEKSEQMFHNRYFERQEGGANVRQIYIETQLLRAMSLAGAGKAEDARRVLDSLGKPVEGLDFTRDGMQPFLHRAQVEYDRARIEKKLGDDDAAREHLKDASSQEGAYAMLAARELGAGDWKASAAKLAAAREPSMDRAIALNALGKTAEAGQVLRDVLRTPDQNLSHYHARRALSAVPGH